MGRDRKPEEWKVLAGNPSKTPGKTVPKSMTGRPVPPADLRGEAFAEWARVTAFLEKVGRIEAIDFAALVVYCSAWAMFDSARQALEEHGPLVLGRDGALVKNPAAQIMRDAADTMLKYGAKFGFTPRDRMNLGLTTGEDDAVELDRQLRALG